MKFYSILDRPKEFRPTDPGSEIAPVYERVDDEYGSWHLEKVGERNVQKAIDSARPPAMADVLKHALRGDMTFMTNQDGYYSTGDEPYDLGDAVLLKQNADYAAALYAAKISTESEMIDDAKPAEQ